QNYYAISANGSVYKSSDFLHWQLIYTRADAQAISYTFAQPEQGGKVLMGNMNSAFVYEYSYSESGVTSLKVNLGHGEKLIGVPSEYKTKLYMPIFNDDSQTYGIKYCSNHLSSDTSACQNIKLSLGVQSIKDRLIVKPVNENDFIVAYGNKLAFFHLEGGSLKIKGEWIMRVGVQQIYDVSVYDSSLIYVSCNLGLLKFKVDDQSSSSLSLTGSYYIHEKLSVPYEWGLVTKGIVYAPDVGGVLFNLPSGTYYVSSQILREKVGDATQVSTLPPVGASFKSDGNAYIYSMNGAGVFGKFLRLVMG
ncbi:MAG: hypothetical protein ACRY3E_06060, partial [Candidatus Lariskella arthropodorum]